MENKEKLESMVVDLYIGCMSDFKPPMWRSPDGKPLACVEKVKVLNENLLEIRELAQEALEDTVLMGGSEEQFFAALDQLKASLKNPYNNRGGS